MKKSKIILSILLALVLLFTVAMSAACVDNVDPDPGETPGGDDNPGGNEQPPVTEAMELQKITISGNYKTEYQLNEAFSKDGLTVSATMKGLTTGKTYTRDVTAQAVVDSSRFNSAMVGVYTITISYTHENVTRYADYSVKVLPYEPSINGISMTKTTLDYDIPSGHLTVSVNLDDITVKAVNANGEEEATPLTADAYALSFYKSGQKVDSLENVARGSYTIQAERKSDGQKAFVIVNVTGGVESINASTAQETVELANESATVEINTQDITVKTDSGAVVVADATNGPCIALSYKLYSVVDGTETVLDTWTVGAGTYKVKVTATYNNPATASTVDFSAEVAITVKVKAASTSQYHNYMLSANNLTAGDITAEKVWLEADTDGNSVSILASSGKKVTVDGNSKSMDGYNFTQRIKINGAGSSKERCFKITVTDTTTITVYVMSGNSSETRQVNLLDSTGNDVFATVGGIMDTDTTPTLNPAVEGTKLHKIVITVEAGTYYLTGAAAINFYCINLEIGQA